MAIITNSLKYFLAQTFISNLAAANNVYLFIGRSLAWRDPEARLGSGNLTLTAATVDLLISNGQFTADMLGATVKNLDLGEIREITQIISPSHAIVGAPPSVSWNTSNWKWKSVQAGSIWIDDNNPSLPNPSLINVNERDNDMLAMKRLDFSAPDNIVSYVIPRYNYEANTTVYAHYKDDDGDLLVHPTQNDLDIAAAWNSSHLVADQYTPGSHYVLVESGSNFHVFKCLDNGGDQNKSTVTPDKTQCTPANNYVHSAADGYKWKFMYSLSASQALDFLSDSWVPVRTALVGDIGDQEVEQFTIQTAAIPGAIEQIDVLAANVAVPFFGDMNVGTALPSQTGATNVEVILPGTASGVDGTYVGEDIFVFTPVTQTRLITAYNGTTKIATVDTAWTTQPTSSNNVCIAPHVTIDGLLDDNGESAEARALVNLSGYVYQIRMTDVGRNYRLAVARAVINDIDVADIKAQISPIAGHGGDAVKELGGYNVMIHCEIKNIEGVLNTDNTYDFITENDYRSVGIIKDVKNGNGQYPTDETLKAVSTLKVTVSPLSAYFTDDEVIEYQDSQQNVIAKGYVVQQVKDIAQTLGYDTVSFVQDEESGFGPFAPISGGVLVGITSGTQATILEVESAEIKHFTGDILYIEQRKPVDRQVKQEEDIKLVLEM